MLWLWCCLVWAALSAQWLVSKSLALTLSLLVYLYFYSKFLYRQIPNPIIIHTALPLQSPRIGFVNPSCRWHAKKEGVTRWPVHSSSSHKLHSARSYHDCTAGQVLTMTVQVLTMTVLLDRYLSWLRTPMALNLQISPFIPHQHQLDHPPSPFSKSVIYTCVALWGVGEGVWQAQIGVLYAELFPSDKTAAFSNYRYFSEEIEKRRRGGLWTKEGGGSMAEGTRPGAAL